MDNLLNEFKDYLTIKNYCNAYSYKIVPFMKFAKKTKIDIFNITIQDLNKYLLLLNKKKYSKGYINNLIKAIRTFYKFLIYNDKIDESILKTINKIKLSAVEQKIRDHITKEELKEMIRWGIICCTFMPIDKLKAIMYFLFYTGIRKGQFLRLKRKDIDLKKRSLIVRVPTKNDKEYITWFPEHVKKRLKNYFESEKEGLNAFNISEGKLMYLFNFLKDFVPEGKTFSIHTMRHGYCNMLIRDGIDIRIVQKLMGHKSLSSTLIYANPDEKTAEENYKKNVK